MNPKQLTNNNSDLDNLFPEFIRESSKTHWTSVEVINVVIDWLGLSFNTKVLDIGSGSGKFCLAGGLQSKANFTGVEKRGNLVQEANIVLKKLALSNVNFIHGNITEINFPDFDVFYYYNPFGEQIAIGDWIDNEISFSEEKFNVYEKFVSNQLATMPFGTKVVTYYSPNFELPLTYQIRNMMFDGSLVLWEKIKG